MNHESPKANIEVITTRGEVLIQLSIDSASWMPINPDGEPICLRQLRVQAEVAGRLSLVRRGDPEPRMSMAVMRRVVSGWENMDAYLEGVHDVEFVPHPPAVSPSDDRSWLKLAPTSVLELIKSSFLRDMDDMSTLLEEIEKELSCR